jgi:hypothetical protein
MKTGISIYILGFAFILLNPTNLIGQGFYDWGERFPLTDSVSDNMNPHLVLIYNYNSNQEKMNMVWEKSEDASSSAIYYDDLLTPDEPQAIVSEPGVHFTHPKILKVNGDEFLFYVFYQSDENGNQDIYYIKYGADGMFTGPFPFATNEFDEQEFVTDNEPYFKKSSLDRDVVSSFAWTSGGELFTSDLENNGNVYTFSDPVLIDGATCTNPVVVTNQMIYYIRGDDSGSFIYVVYKQTPQGTWTEPEIYFNEGNCFNLAEDNVTPQFLAWSADSNGVYRSYMANSYWDYNGYALGPGSETPLDPAVCTIVIGVAPEQDQFMDYYMAFPYPENGNEEIFMNEGWGGVDFLNFSQSNTLNRNPEFFIGESYQYEWCFYVYLTWEEFRNEHWQIFCSKTIMCYGGLDENIADGSFLYTYPNPFNDEATVSYTLHSDESIKIEVIDIYGRKIKDLFSGKQLSGEQQIQWNGRDTGGNTVPDGIYFIRLSSDKLSACSRLIKVN